jgi:hypothetical protein
MAEEGRGHERGGGKSATGDCTVAEEDVGGVGAAIHEIELRDDANCAVARRVDLLP